MLKSFLLKHVMLQCIMFDCAQLYVTDRQTL